MQVLDTGVNIRKDEFLKGDFAAHIIHDFIFEVQL